MSIATSFVSFDAISDLAWEIYTAIAEGADTDGGSADAPTDGRALASTST